MNGKPWTQAEEAVMREKYLKGGWMALLRLLPGRSKAAIQNKACELGVTADRSGPRDRGKGKARKRA